MSTKIYNGLKFKETNLIAILKQLQGIVPKAKEIARKHVIDIEIGKIVALKNLFDVDKYEVLKQLELSSAKPELSKNWEDLCIDFSVFIYPHSNGNYYGYHFCDLRDYKSLLTEFTEDYHYQNQSDQSNYDWEKEPWNEMSEERQKELSEDWKEREEVWEELLGDDSFRFSGFEYVIVDGTNDLWDFDILQDIINIQKKLKEQKIRKEKLENLDKQL